MKMTKGGNFVMQKWPRKRGAIKSPAQRQTAEQFALAQKAAAEAHPWLYIEADIMSTGTIWNRREILVKAAQGNLFEIRLANGEFYGNWFTLAKEIQALLDTVTDEIGALIVRGPAGWVAINPGPTEYLLSSGGPDAVPAWSPPAATPVFAQWFLSQCQADSTIAFPTRGNVLTPMFDITIDQVMWAGNRNASYTYFWTVYTINSSNVIQTIVKDFDASAIIPTGNGEMLVQLDAELNLTKGTRYAVCWRQVGGGDTSSMTIPGADQYFSGYPSRYQNASLRLAKQTPAIGNTFIIGTNIPFTGFRWRRTI